MAERKLIQKQVVGSIKNMILIIYTIIYRLKLNKYLQEYDQHEQLSKFVGNMNDFRHCN